MILKQQLEKIEYEEIKETITSIEAATKKIWHERKFKKYCSLKCKSTPVVKVKKTAEETGNTENRTYGEVTRADRKPTRRLSKTINAGNKHNQNIYGKLRSISQTNRFRRQWNNLSKKPYKH